MLTECEPTELIPDSGVSGRQCNTVAVIFELAARRRAKQQLMGSNQSRSPTRSRSIADNKNRRDLRALSATQSSNNDKVRPSEQLLVHMDIDNESDSSGSLLSEDPNVESRILSTTEPIRDNLVMLPSALDPLGRTIRRISTEIVDDQEQLLLVKRRASAAKAIALQEGPEGEECDDPIVEKKPMTPQDFEYLKVIGIGGIGRVVLVRNLRNQKLYAMKVVSKRSVLENGLMGKILSERDVLGGTHHHSLVHLHWAFQTRRSLFLVMDYCPGGELSLHLQRAGRFSEDTAVFYAAEMVLALEHLHRHGIVYRDLKPENLLLTARGHLKLVDFGISKFGITEPTLGAQTLCGSYEYLAPEVLKNQEYGTAVDWWSFGVVLYEMLTGLPPWYSHNREVMHKRILHSPLECPDYLSQGARDILRGLLMRDPQQRLGSKEGSAQLRQHPFFRSIDWQMIMFRETQAPIEPCPNQQSIEEATNFNAEFTRLSIGSVAASDRSSLSEDFKGFDFQAPVAPHIQYGYGRDVHRRHS